MRFLFSCFVALTASLTLAAPIGHVVRTTTNLEIVNLATNFELPFGSTTFATDSLAVDPSGMLYSANAGGVIFGVGGPPIPIGATGFTGIGDLDYGAGGLWGYSNASATLFKFDLTSNTVSYSVAMSSLLTYTVTGVAYRPDGTIFLCANTGLNQDVLFSVGPSATTPILIGTMFNGDAFSYFSDIDFDSAGTLYAMSWYHRDFYTVNAGTGTTTLFSTGPHRDSTGMALPALTAAPGPAAAFVWLFGVMGRSVARRRRATC